MAGICDQGVVLQQLSGSAVPPSFPTQPTAMSPNRTVHDRRPVVRPLVVALSALLPLAAAAQEAPATKDPVALDALQVTAQRRVENARDVPVAITAIQGEKLDVLGSAG